MSDNAEWRRKLGVLTKDQILMAAFPLTFSRATKRNKQLLIAEAAELQGEGRTRLEVAVREKETGLQNGRAVMHDWSGRLSTLTKSELADVLRPYGFFPGSIAAMTKANMIAEASTLDGNLKDILQEAVRVKESAGRRRRGRPVRAEREQGDEDDGEDEDDDDDANEDPQLTTSQRVLRAIEQYNPDIDRFMNIPSEEDVRLRHQLYYDATSNEELAQAICVCCAREVWKKETEDVVLAELKSKDKLVPYNTHPAHDLHDGMLLLCDRLQESEDGLTGTFCNDCLRSLGKGQRPRLSLANNMWIGDLPDCMTLLTIPEQLLIAQHYPRCFVFKLFPKNGGFRDPDTLQRGMAGNVTTYAMNSDAIVEMLEGKLMPRPPELLASVIAVSFIGLGTLPKKWLKGTFRVRRAVVHEALQWLKANNEMYKDVQISNEALRILPEDGIPDAILANVCQEQSESLARQESATYVPMDDLGDDAIGGPVDGDAGRQREPTVVNEDEDDGDDSGNGEPDVIPLQSLGAIDLDLNNLSANDLMMWALANSSGEKEGGYLNRHGRDPVNMFGRPRDGEARESEQGTRKNPLAAAYPTLFPYGMGGIEDDREEDVAFGEHVRWALQYHDRRFRTNHSFPFVVFGIMQRREIMRSARLQMRKDQFTRHSLMLSTITGDDIRKALGEMNGNPNHTVSDPRLRLLNKLVFGCGSKVMGSNESRTMYRQDIWATTVWKGPPNLWVTINPSDGHDPMVQIFAGEDIDMDKFNRLMGPDSMRRAQNVAFDPYAAAKYFNHVIKLILEKLFGITVVRGKVKTEMGLLGRLSAYKGVVEAQGRGTLHLHILFWLEDSPTGDEMLDLLEHSEDFRNKIRRYIEAVIGAYVPELSNKDEIRAVPREADIAYSRPPNPSDQFYEEEKKDILKKIVRSQQIHTCTTATCLIKRRNGEVSCKRRAPFPSSDEAYVLPNGEWGPKRTYGYINNFIPEAIVVIKCNQDAKLVLFGRDTKNTGWYMTIYQTKNQNKSFNYSAFVARGFLYHLRRSRVEYIEDVRDKGRKLLIRCANAVNQEQELSAPQVMSYLMGWGDVYRSHHYVPFYWFLFARHLRRCYPEFKRTTSSRPEESEAEGVTRRNEDGNDVGEEDPRQVERNVEREVNDPEGINEERENITLNFGRSGIMESGSQLEDYALRGTELEQFPLIFFISETYDAIIPLRERGGSGSNEGREQRSREGQDETRRRGRKPNERSRYLEEHRKSGTHYRIVRTPGHNTIPSTRGGFYPTHTDPDAIDFFRASMLTICKPWRRIEDLKEENQTWEEAYDSFLAHAPKRIHHIIAGIKYHYDSRTAANLSRDTEGDMDAGTRRRRRNRADNVEDEDDEDHSNVEVTDFDRQRLAQAIEELRNSREEVHGKAAIVFAKSAGIFTSDDSDWEISGVQAGACTGDDIVNLERWQATLKSSIAQAEPIEARDEILDDGSVTLIESSETEHVEYVTPDTFGVGETEMPGIDPSCLLTEQRRAYDIVDFHLRQTLEGKQPTQLLMHIPGEGGVGKSKVIQTITDQFAALGVKDRLVKAAYTGIAASLIGGSTLHVICRIPPPRDGSRKERKIVHSPQVEKELAESWSNKTYLIIDEISMVPKEMMAQMSRIISKARAHLPDHSPTLPFGGLNVIILGDMHQFPPVAGGASHALFTRIRDSDLGKEELEDFVQGRKIYEQFDEVVKLRQQVRVQDDRWRDLLRRARHGNCGAEDISILRGLIITRKECPRTNFSQEPWSEAVLVTPRHAVRRQWNEAAVERHCRLTGATLYISPADDKIRGRALTPLEELLTLRKKDTCLAPKVQLAIGMKVMVTFNVNTEKDIANGSRGRIHAIILDEREPPSEGSRVLLKYPPAYVLVKLDRSKAPHLDGLPEGVVPIVPIQKSLYIKPGKQRVRVTRTQLPITPAYAFTDYRSQGQTIEYVIVDIGWPPSGGLTGFNAYVALSRSSGRDTIRLLRDFNSKLFTEHPNEDLRLEDRRLEEEDRKTWMRWDVIFGRQGRQGH